MDENNNIAELREKIGRYRALARLTTDQETVRRIQGLVEELETQLKNIEQSPDDEQSEIAAPELRRFSDTTRV